jgi:hypothetical protein
MVDVFFIFASVVPSILFLPLPSSTTERNRSQVLRQRAQRGHGQEEKSADDEDRP